MSFPMSIEALPTTSWTVTHTGPPPTSESFPDFPIARYDSGASIYQEALWNGQFLGAQLTGMGRARPRWWIWGDLKDGATSDRPLRTRQHAFGLEIDGQQLVDGWELTGEDGGQRDLTLHLTHAQRRISVDVHTALDDTPFFARHLTITNDGDRPCAIAQVSEQQLYDEVDLAAELGFELFMLDAGWFGGTESYWQTTVGNWDESPLLTKGVRAVMDYVHSKGLLAGIWVEPERVGAESRLMAEHPEWLMQRRGEAIPNLDLSQPEVVDYVENLVVSIIEKYDLDCFRLDYNVNIGEGGSVERDGYTENVLWRHYDALYGIFDRVAARFPELLLENCASGGGRMDLGMMSRFHWTQLTDRWSPGPAVRVINGGTLALPPEMTESVTGGISGGQSDIDFLIRINLFGHVKISGIAPTLAERNQATWARWQHGIELYKSFCRPMLSESVLYHHTPIQRQIDPGEWVVLESATPARDKAFVGVFRLLGATEDTYTVRPRGLDAGRTYRVRYDSAGYDREIDGGRLMDEGIRVRVPSALRSELLLIEAR
jgi:alpha-galactosidase